MAREITSFKQLDTTTTRRGDSVDYRKFRVSSRVIVCPKCKKKGRLVRYTKGGAHVAHLEIFKDWYWLQKESCFFPKGQEPTKGTR